MRHVYLAYLDKLYSQPHNCPRQANSNPTMARLKYCRVFDKLAWLVTVLVGVDPGNEVFCFQPRAYHIRDFFTFTDGMQMVTLRSDGIIARRYSTR